LERDPVLVCTDLRAGKISRQRAHDVYGVVYDAADNAVDWAATATLRSGRSNPKQ
jgi:N-methylhydantoinase B/oxoprolinase/acetone carboxylase alpha subunit